MPITPVFVEKMTGDQSAPALEEQGGGVSTDPRLTEYVNWVGGRMLPFSLRGSEKHTYKVLNSKDVVNAFALGNGNVYITKGLLNLLDDEAELAEILGHENGHYGHRHIAAQMDRGIGLALLLALGEGFYADSKGGAVSDTQQEAMDQANLLIPALVLNGFGRAQELEADGHGLETMVKAGYDPMGSVRVFQKFQALEPKVQGLDVFLASHPTAKDRVSDLKTAISRKYAGFAGESFPERFQAIVRGNASLSDTLQGQVLGIPTPLAIAGGAALAITAGIVIASL